MADDFIAFEIVSDVPVPIFPVAGREVNGDTIVSLTDCVMRFGGTAEERRRQWRAAWGHYENGETLAGSAEERKQAIASTVGWDVIRKARFPHIIEDDQWAFVKQFCFERSISPMEIGVRLDIDPNTDRPIVQVITTIAAIRRMADRSGKRKGESAPEYCGADGVWKPAPWLDETIPPKAARVIVTRTDTDHRFEGIAEWKRCVQLMRDKNDNVVLTEAWDKGGPFQLGRCASAAAHRYAFPDAVGQIYTLDEMDLAAKAADPAEKRVDRRSVDAAESAPAMNFVTGEVKETPSLPDDPRRAMELVDESTPSISRLPIELVFAGAAGNVEAAKQLIQTKYRLWWPKLYAYSDPRVFVAAVLSSVPAAA